MGQCYPSITVPCDSSLLNLRGGSTTTNPTDIGANAADKIMGSLLSTSSSSPPAEQKRILGTTDITKPQIPASSDLLFLDEVKAEPAAWTEESICRTFQRFLGLLPDSPGEVLKKEQQYPIFRHRSTALVFNVGEHMGVIIVIQRLYRRYRRLRTWHEVSDHMVQIARGRLAVLRAQEQENISAASFRLLLAKGFSASKVCISGALKTVQLRLVLNPEAGECYLTWIPSRKKKPRINLHDIEQVVAVRKEGNPEAPRLSKKVSYRRGIILVCKSYHRERVVLEVATKQERNILFQGFLQLLSEMTATEPTVDDVGALRSQHPRRQSVIEFFSTTEEAQSPAVASADDHSALTPSVFLSGLSSERDSVPVYRPEPLAVDAPPLAEALNELPAQELSKKTDAARENAKGVEHFYQTRFDSSPENAISLPSHSSRRPSRAMEVRH